MKAVLLEINNKEWKKKQKHYLKIILKNTWCF